MAFCGCPLARFAGLLEVLWYRLAGAGREDVDWYGGKEGAQAACVQRAKWEFLCGL